MNMPRARCLAGLAGAIAWSVVLSEVTNADAIPDAVTASPEIYKVLAENAQLRVIEAEWQPGARDEFHAHTGARAILYANDCKLRVYLSDGTARHASPRGGRARVSETPVVSHSVENVGEEPCKMWIVESRL